MSRAKVVGGWIVAVLLGLQFLLAGSVKFTMREGWIGRFAAWGYPPWFVTVVGLAEVAGAVLIVIPRTRLYGAGLLGATMAGAAYTHLSSGIGSPVVPLLTVVLCGVLFWLGRGEQAAD